MQALFGFDKFPRIHVKPGLHLAKPFKGHTGLFRPFIDLPHDVIEIELRSHGALNLVITGKTNQGVPGANVEIDVGQRFDFLHAFHLGHQLEEEAELAYLYGLLHNIHPV